MGIFRSGVLGTGPGHNAIYYAGKGFPTTGIDSSPAAIERAKANAERAGVSVNFQVADATKLEGLENRFNTVIDSAFYHVFFEDEETQRRYLQALRRATKPTRASRERRLESKSRNQRTKHLRRHVRWED